MRELDRRTGAVRTWAALGNLPTPGLLSASIWAAGIRAPRCWPVGQFGARLNTRRLGIGSCNVGKLLCWHRFFNGGVMACTARAATRVLRARRLFVIHVDKLDFRNGGGISSRADATLMSVERGVSTGFAFRANGSALRTQKILTGGTYAWHLWTLPAGYRMEWQAARHLFVLLAHSPDAVLRR